MSKRVTIHVKGMHCKGCSLGLQGALERVPQVSSATASHENGEAIVVWNGDSGYEDMLRGAVAGAGFEVVSFDE